MKLWLVVGLLLLQGGCASHAVSCSTRLRPINPPAVTPGVVRASP